MIFLRVSDSISFGEDSFTVKTSASRPQPMEWMAGSCRRCERWCSPQVIINFRRFYIVLTGITMYYCTITVPGIIQHTSIYYAIICYYHIVTSELEPSRALVVETTVPLSSPTPTPTPGFSLAIAAAAFATLCRLRTAGTKGVLSVTWPQYQPLTLMTSLLISLHFFPDDLVLKACYRLELQDLSWCLSKKRWRGHLMSPKFLGFCISWSCPCDAFVRLLEAHCDVKPALTTRGDLCGLVCQTSSAVIYIYIIYCVSKIHTCCSRYAIYYIHLCIYIMHTFIRYSIRNTHIKKRVSCII